MINISCAENGVIESVVDTVYSSVLFQSVYVGDNFVIDVSLPEGYLLNPDSRYPVIYLTDGNWRRAQHKPIHDLNKSDGVEEMIVVGISYPDNYDVNTIRVRDFITYPGKYLDFLLKEVIPFVEQKYRTNSERTLWGSSFGGFFAFYALFQYTEKTKDVFKNYIIASAAAYQTTQYLDKQLNIFDFEQLHFQKSNELCANLYLTVGGDEVAASFVEPFNRLVVTMESRHYSRLNLQFYCDPGKNHYTVWEPSLYQGIKLFMKKSAGLEK